MKSYSRFQPSRSTKLWKCGCVSASECGTYNLAVAEHSEHQNYMNSLRAAGKRLGFSQADIESALTIWIDLKDGKDHTPQRFRDIRQWLEREMRSPSRAEPYEPANFLLRPSTAFMCSRPSRERDEGDQPRST